MTLGTGLDKKSHAHSQQVIPRPLVNPPSPWMSEDLQDFQQHEGQEQEDNQSTSHEESQARLLA